MVKDTQSGAEYTGEYDTTMVPVAKAKAAMLTQEGAAELSDAAAMFSELRPVSYFMKEKDQTEAKNLRFGFIAQEIEKILPSLVATDTANDKKSIYYSDIIAIVAMTLQHEIAVTSKLEGVVADHETRLVGIKSKLATLEAKHGDSAEERIMNLEAEIMQLR